MIYMNIETWTAEAKRRWGDDPSKWPVKRRPGDIQMPDRYRLNDQIGVLTINPDGEWVRWRDVAHEHELCERLKLDVARLTDEREKLRQEHRAMRDDYRAQVMQLEWEIRDRDSDGYGYRQ